MFKSFISIFVTFIIILSTQSVLADVLSNIKTDIKNMQRGNNTATAVNRGGNNNRVIAFAGVVNINIENSYNTKIQSNINSKFNISHWGNNTATATNKGGSNNYIRATASIVSLNIYSNYRR